MRKFGMFSSLVAPLALLLMVGGAQAGPYTINNDSTSDRWGPAMYEVYGLDYRIENGYLDIKIRTSFPQAGDTGGSDSYGSGLLFSPGDLYINVGGSYTAKTGQNFGLGLTNHIGDLTADPNDNALAWSQVNAGNLYSNATFVTGTAEDYDQAGLSGSPYDGGLDPYGHKNNLPTFIAAYGSNLGYQSAVNWTAVSGQPWAYEVTTSISLAALDLYGKNFELWWAMECGNDAVKTTGYAPPVPEPATLACFALGLGVVLRRRRRAA
ncbi:MAG: PEP-CTERM sorting domain-containing protein [Fimbriimonadaceae bacterium]|nr:PEP-CTERM sorting domain-containing protein [Fimbriimonadaceae bacterium]